MKKVSIMSVFVVFALLLSACSMHLGLSSLLHGNSPAATAKPKKIKATHTPPSPPNSTVATPVPQSTPAGDEITITGTGYQPNSLQVKVGSVLTWKNMDNAVHTVTSDTAGMFDSGPINANATFTFTFSQPGTFTYHSTGDSAFKGAITVSQ